jgi:hypothetical protein
MNNKIKILLTVVITTITVLTVFSKLKGEEFKYSWEPAKLGNQIRLPLLENEPDSFSLIFPCSLLRNEPNWILDAQGGSALQFQLFPEKINIVLENSNAKLKNFEFDRKAEFSDKCNEFISFERDTREITYGISSNVTKLIVGKQYRFPIRSWLQWNNQVNNYGVKVTINTRPRINTTNSENKNIINFLWIATAFIMISISIKNLNIRKIKFQRNEKISIVSLIILGFIGVPKYDDGWYLLTATAMDNDKVYTNYAYPLALPNGYLHAKVLSFLTDENPSIFLLRLPGIISALIIWILISRVFIPWFATQSSQRLPIHIFWSFWLVFSVAFFITLRPEPIIAVLLTFILSLVLINDRISNNLTNFFILSTMGLAIAIHQSGTVVVSSGTALLVINNLQLLRKKEMNWLGLIWGLNFLVFIIFWNNSPKNLISSLKIYNDIDLIYPGSVSITSNPFNEYERILSIFKYGIVPNIQTWLILLFLLTVLFYAVMSLKFGIKNLNFVEIRLVIVIHSAFLGLLFATSKWASYYGVLVSAFMVLFFLVFKQNQKTYFRIFHIFVIFIYLYSFSKDWKSTIFEIPFRSSTSIFIQNIQSRGFVMLTISFILLLVSYLIFKQNQFTFITTLNLIFIFTYIFNPVLDSILSKKSWTFIGQSVQGVYNKSLRCGLAFDTKLTNDPNLSVQEFETYTSGSTVLTPGNFFYSPCLKPISAKLGRWEMPDIVVGSQIFDQQRLFLGTDLIELGCNPILKSINQLNRLDYCFFKVQSTIPEIGLPDKSEFLF